jgi:hypothetical protein
VEVDDSRSSEDSNQDMEGINEKGGEIGEQGTASTNADKDQVGVEMRESENEDFEVTPDSQIFEVLSSDGNS